MKPSVRTLFSTLALALVAVGPLARGQDTPPAAPSGGDDQAPPPPPVHHRRGMSAEEYKAKLNLTDAQFTQVSAILAKLKEDATAVREDDSLSDDDKRDKMMAIMKSGHDQIRALLTPDQQKIFDTLRPQHGGPPRPPADAPPPASN